MRFDTIFPVGTRLPPRRPSAAGTGVCTTRRTTSGHFRYLESSSLTDGGEPSGDIGVWDEILFPFDPI